MIFSTVYFCDTNRKPSIYMLTQAIQFMGIHPLKKKNESTQKFIWKEFHYTIFIILRLATI